jgi:hypothetical protein
MARKPSIQIAGPWENADEIYRMDDIASSMGEESALALLSSKIKLPGNRLFSTQAP